MSLNTEQTTQVMFGDIVWLSHIERDTCLEYRKKPGKISGHFEPDMDSIKEEGVVGRISGEDILRIQQRSVEILKQRSDFLFFEKFENKEVKNTIAMWKIEAEDYCKGGAVGWESRIRFKNLRFLMILYNFERV